MKARKALITATTCRKASILLKKHVNCLIELRPKPLKVDAWNNCEITRENTKKEIRRKC